MTDYDLAVIGGGINGVGIARDAAGRGMRVLLVEQDDLASATSSASTKLIHGGLRYLEHGAVRLVHEALAEREVLLRMAPHLIRPLRFVLPHHAALRPAWILRLGLFLYDHLGGRKLLPGTRSVDLAHGPLGQPLQGRFARGFEYSDCWVDDARLVVLNAVDAAERGATILTRTRCVGAERGQDAAGGAYWRLALQPEAQAITARALVNTAGPWVAQVNEDVLRLRAHAPVRLVKGSHIVVPRLFDHDRAYIFQSADQRIVFAIPYERAFTLIGTTDVDYQGDPAHPAASDEEVRYLCGVVSDYFREPVAPADVVWSYAGVRPLYDDGASKAKDATRDYVLALDAPEGEAPALTVYGGKITTYRRLAEAALGKLATVLRAEQGADERVWGGPWTQAAPLPGGELAWDGVPALAQDIRRRWPFVNDSHALRLARAYGARVERILRAARSSAEVGPVFGEAITAAEIRYLMAQEWAVDADDVLWRRTKLGLHLTAPEQAALADFMLHEGGRRAAV